MTYTDPLTNLPDDRPVALFQLAAGDNGDYTSIDRGIYNANEGFYIDNVMVGFAERGEMITQTPSNTPAAANTTFNFVDLTQYPSALRESTAPATTNSRFARRATTALGLIP